MLITNAGFDDFWCWKMNEHWHRIGVSLSGASEDYFPFQELGLWAMFVPCCQDQSSAAGQRHCLRARLSWCLGSGFCWQVGDAFMVVFLYSMPHGCPFQFPLLPQQVAFFDLIVFKGSSSVFNPGSLEVLIANVAPLEGSWEDDFPMLFWSPFVKKHLEGPYNTILLTCPTLGRTKSYPSQRRDCHFSVSYYFRKMVFERHGQDLQQEVFFFWLFLLSTKSLFFFVKGIHFGVLQ